VCDIRLLGAWGRVGWVFLFLRNDWCNFHLCTWVIFKVILFPSCLS